MEKCNTCAWYCHSDGKCWKDSLGENPAYPITVRPEWVCESWAADGLTDEERKEYAAENA